VVTEKTRQEDERLREELRNADMEKFKKALNPLMPVIAPVKTKDEKKKGDQS